MCGRFTLTATPSDLQMAFPGVNVPSNYTPRYNIAPTQPVMVLTNDQPTEFQFFYWGLIPSWAKERSIASRLINARGETLIEKPAFRAAFKRRRCLIIADGFYEWQSLPSQKQKQPQYIHLANHTPFAFAGLWEVWSPPDHPPLQTCTIITTEPNPLMAEIHNRMPVILPPSAYETWLQPDEPNPVSLMACLESYPSTEMTYYPVSTAVNRPTTDAPDLILPLAG